MDAQVVAMSAAIDQGRPREDYAARMTSLFDAHHQRLFRLARRLARPPEEPADLVQETFLRAARALHSVPPGAVSEEAWLVRVMVNLCRDSWRHAAVRNRTTIERRATRVDAADSESGIIAHIMVWQALDTLPPRRRAILVLYELEGAPIARIAQLLGITPVTVRWHLMIARRQMARALGDST